MIRAAHARSRARPDVTDSDNDGRGALIAGGSAMGAFTLLGLGAAAGWLDASVSLAGATFAIVVYVASLVHMHRKEDIQ